MNSTESAALTDLHSHLVPGVDDGARTLEESLDGIGRLWENGVRTLVTTPHLDASLTRRPELLEDRLNEVDLAWEGLRVAVSEAFPGLELHRGHEVMLDIPDPDFSDPRIRLAETDSVLVEWPHLKVPPATSEALSRIRDAGYGVILAHPERYHGLDAGLRLAGRWREAGALLQVNYGSLLGRYGEDPRKRALTLLERGWVDLFATDFHGRTHLSVYLRKAKEVMEMMDGDEQFDLLARVNPARVLRGEDTYLPPPLPRKKGVWEKVLGMISKKERR